MGGPGEVRREGNRFILCLRRKENVFIPGGVKSVSLKAFAAARGRQTKSGNPPSKPRG